MMVKSCAGRVRRAKQAARRWPGGWVARATYWIWMRVAWVPCFLGKVKVSTPFSMRACALVSSTSTGSMKLRKPLQAPGIVVVPGVAGRWFLQVDEDLPKARVYRID